MTNNRPRKELFYKAADIILERGSTTGKLIDHEGRVCALGALGLAAGFPEDRLHYSRITEAIGLPDDQWYNIAGPSDHADRNWFGFLRRQRNRDKARAKLLRDLGDQFAE